MATPRPHDMMTCPYNPAHQVEQYRMHIHLQKCRKQHPNDMKVSCPFDSSHIVNDVELDYHMSVCPKRYLLDNQMYVTDGDFRPKVTVVAPCTASVHGEENWDDDTVVYKPDLSKKKGIITKIKGATPSERRKHRMESIKNFQPTEPADEKQ